MSTVKNFQALYQRKLNQVRAANARHRSARLKHALQATPKSINELLLIREVERLQNKLNAQRALQLAQAEWENLHHIPGPYEMR